MKRKTDTSTLIRVAENFFLYLQQTFSSTLLCKFQKKKTQLMILKIRKIWNSASSIPVMGHSYKSTIIYYRQCVWPADWNNIHHPTINLLIDQCSCKPETNLRQILYCVATDHRPKSKTHWNLGLQNEYNPHFFSRLDWSNELMEQN